MRQLMGHHCADSLLLAVAGLERIDEKVDFAVRHYVGESIEKKARENWP